MAEDSRDVLMKIVLDGTAIPAECSAVVVNDKDPLSTGFVTASQGNDWKGNYFALEEFEISLGLLAESKPGAAPPSQADKEQHAATQAVLKEQQKKLDELAKKAGEEGTKLSGGNSGGFERFMNQGRSATRAKSYSANLEPVEITKKMDASSLTLFKACINSTTLDSAVLIKRRGSGADQLRTYLRIEFIQLLITDFNWDEDEVVKEKIKFVCREVHVKYSIENDDGTLKPPGQERIWTVKKGNLPSAS
jgi:type VI protein secretion system component Hcp